MFKLQFIEEKNKCVFKSFYHLERDCATSPDQKRVMLSQRKESLNHSEQRFRKKYDHIFKSCAPILKIKNTEIHCLLSLIKTA